MNKTLTAIEGLRVGHAVDKSGTGCTVILFEPMAEVAYEARGGYPTTFDTDGIDVGKRFVKRHAVFLAGGDVYGLDCPAGIRRYLLERREVTMTAGGQMPLIVGATIYDMWRAEISKVSYPDIAYNACLNASTDQVPEGNVGSGIGGSAGGFGGHDRSGKGGTGSFATQLFDGICVAALMVTNCMGNVRDPDTGEILEGVRDRNTGKFIQFEDVMEEYVRSPRKKENTTIGIVATNAELTHEELVKVAQMAHDGLAMSIRPTHTTSDGDTIFAVSTGKIKSTESRPRMLDAIGYLSARCVAISIARSVTVNRPRKM